MLLVKFAALFSVIAVTTAISSPHFNGRHGNAAAAAATYQALLDNDQQEPQQSERYATRQRSPAGDLSDLAADNRVLSPETDKDVNRQLLLASLSAARLQRINDVFNNLSKNQRQGPRDDIIDDVITGQLSPAGGEKTQQMLSSQKLKRQPFQCLVNVVSCWK